ncbi:hypothetical protein OS493_012383 [Desmophyllum pertusum]|uniref:Uncharacterized protein n=1 Tax=Desmophyllum pertusum TaxID=174260 RepID=A0A9W9ZU64_9CNID|nr:hypothetical protein OS493_012383 [Desmophyllum pertusum]
MSSNQEMHSQELLEGDAIALTIKLSMEIILDREIYAFANDLKLQMANYRNNLSNKLLEKLPEIGQSPLCMGKFLGSFTAGWREWKKDEEDKEEASFRIFTTQMETFPKQMETSPAQMESD